MPAPIQNPFLATLGQGLYYAAIVYVWLILIRVLLTWLNPNPYSPVMRFLSRAVDPVLNRGRRLFPLTLGGMDFSPILVIIIIQLLGTVLGQWLVGLGQGAPGLMLAPLAVLGLVSLLYSVAWFLIILMAARLIMGFVHPSPYNIIVRVVYGLTEPLLAPLRRFLPPGSRGADFRPLFFLVATILVQQVVLGNPGDPQAGGLSGAALRWMGEISRGL